MMELLRFATAGSVDDGKSTLIGRLLYDSKPIFEDQLEAVERTSRAARRRVHRTSRCSPTACAPSASRASRSTSPTATSPRRSASSSSPTRPGHIQYTRNMVTGASTADLALDPGRRAQRRHRADRGGTRSSRRCSASRTSCCASTRWTSSTTTRTSSSAIEDEFREFAAKLDVARPHVHPDLGAATATTSSSAPTNMPWYEGTSLLHHLEEVHIALRPQPHRLPLPGAVRRSARRRRATTTTAATRAGRRRHVQARRRGHGAAVGLHVDDRVDRHRRRPGRRGLRRRCR